MVRPERIFVAPEFKKIIKIKAAEKNISIIKLTEMMSKEMSPIGKIEDEFNFKRKKKSFDFF